MAIDPKFKSSYQEARFDMLDIVEWEQPDNAAVKGDIKFITSKGERGWLYTDGTVGWEKMN